MGRRDEALAARPEDEPEHRRRQRRAAPLGNRADAAHFDEGVSTPPTGVLLPGSGRGARAEPALEAWLTAAPGTEPSALEASRGARGGPTLEPSRSAGSRADAGASPEPGRADAGAQPRSARGPSRARQPPGAPGGQSRALEPARPRAARGPSRSAWIRRQPQGNGPRALEAPVATAQVAAAMLETEAYGDRSRELCARGRGRTGASPIRTASALASRRAAIWSGSDTPLSAT